MGFITIEITTKKNVLYFFSASYANASHDESFGPLNPKKSTIERVEQSNRPFQVEKTRC